MIDPHETSTPEQRRACRNATDYALRTGALVRPKHCSECGAEDRKGNGSKQHTICGHHDDYAKPLEVRWLCVACHHAFHATFGHQKAARLRRAATDLGRAGRVVVDDIYIHDDTPLMPREGDCEIVADPVLAFASALRVVEAEMGEVDHSRVQVKSPAEHMQRSPFIKPHPPARVLAKELRTDRDWQAADARRRVDAVFDVLDDWRTTFIRRAGWVPDEGRRMHRGFLALARKKAPKPSSAVCREAALARYARERIQQEAA